MKNVTALLALLLCVTMISCNDSDDNKMNTDTVSNEITSSVKTDEKTNTETETKNTESTLMTTVETTEPVTTEQISTLPEFDINAPECLPYRLLNMTVAEIEAEFGEMKYEYAHAGAAPCYSIEGYDIIIEFSSNDAICDEPLPRSSMPRIISIYDSNIEIYPGIDTRMNTKEIIDVFKNNDLQFQPNIMLAVFQFYLDNLNDYGVSTVFSLPEEIQYEMRQEAYDEDFNRTDKYEEIISKIYEKMKNGDIIGKVSLIKIMKK